MGILGDEVLIEEAEGGLARGGGEADEEGIEVIENLPPEIVNGAMALVDDDEVERLNGDAGIVGDEEWFFPHRAASTLIPGVFLGLLVEFATGELRVESLNRRNGDLANGIDAAGAEHLHIVEVGEAPSVVGGGVVLKLPDGLATEIAPVDEEEDAPGSGVFDEAVGLGDGGVGLAGAGRHLKKGAGTILGEGALEFRDGVDLAIAKRGGIQPGKVAQARTKRVGLLDQGEEMPGSVEGEDGPGSRVGITLVAEIRLDAGGLVGEGERIGPALGNPPFGGRVALALLGHPGKSRARFLGLEDTDGFAIHKQHVIGRATLRLHLADGHATGGGEIQVDEILNDPTRRRQLGVNGLAGLLFRRGGHGCRLRLRGLRTGRLALPIARFSIPEAPNRGNSHSASSAHLPHRLRPTLPPRLWSESLPPPNTLPPRPRALASANRLHLT